MLDPDELVGRSAELSAHQSGQIFSTIGDTGTGIVGQFGNHDDPAAIGQHPHLQATDTRTAMETLVMETIQYGTSFWGRSGAGRAGAFGTGRVLFFRSFAARPEMTARASCRSATTFIRSS